MLRTQFGEIEIDTELVSQKYDLEGTGDAITLLNNGDAFIDGCMHLCDRVRCSIGCLCCTMREDLINSLNALVSGCLRHSLC